jgi:hypothetical protein
MEAGEERKKDMDQDRGVLGRAVSQTIPLAGSEDAAEINQFLAQLSEAGGRGKNRFLIFASQPKINNL